MPLGWWLDTAMKPQTYLAALALTFLIAGGAVLAARTFGWPLGHGVIYGAPDNFVPAAPSATRTNPPLAARPAAERPAAPSFAFTDESGASHTLADFTGKVVVLNLWATWCVPCVKEMPDLDALAQRFPAAQLVVVPVSLDQGGAKVAREFLTAHGLKALPVYNARLGDAPAVDGLPASYVLDRQGRVAWAGLGEQPWSGDAVLAMIKNLSAASP